MQRSNILIFFCLFFFCIFLPAAWGQLFSHSPGTSVVLAPDGVPVVNGERKIIFGTYRFDSPEESWEQEMTILSDMGFNLIHSYRFETRYNTNAEAYIKDAQSFLTLAARFKMGVFLGLPRKLVAGKEKDIAKIKQIISELKNEPALWIWYIYDEPTRKLKRDLTEVYKTIKELDTSHPVAVVHGKIERLRYCTDFSDLLWTDRYDLPYSFLNIMKLAKNVRDNFSEHSWIVGQGSAVNQIHLAREWTYPSKEGAQSLTFAPGTHRPNPEEIRAQFHHAVSLGSPGIIFYWAPEYYYSLKEETPEVWQALSDLGAEVLELSSVLASEDPVPETELYLNGTKRRYDNLSSLEEDTTHRLKIDVTVASWRRFEVSWGFNIRYWVRMYKNCLYIGLVNATYTPHFLVTLHLPFPYKRVYQIPGPRLIIDRTNSRDAASHLDQADVIIRDNRLIEDTRAKASTRTLSFILDECSTAVWCFEP
jgi:hypothetical protein